VQLFAERAGFTGQVMQWPKTEQEMRALSDPICADFIRRSELGEEVFLRSHRVYTMPLHNALGTSMSALRVDLKNKEKGPMEVTTAFSPRAPLWFHSACNSSYIHKYFHEGLAHPGTNRMIRSLRTKYYWQALDKDCDTYVANCRLCKLRKATIGQGRLPLQRYPIGIRPFQRCHIDLTGPLKKTARGYEWKNVPSLSG
jgi:hypothetical protein